MRKKSPRITAILCILTLLVTLGVPTAAKAKKELSFTAPAPLQFQKDGTFKIIQISDLQELFVTCGIVEDFLYDIAEAEKPDLFVLTGDNINYVGFPPWFFGDWACKQSIDIIMNIFDKIGVPVTAVFGNHDAEGHDSVTRQKEYEWYAAHESFIGWEAIAKPGEQSETVSDNDHYGTHYLQIAKNGSAKPVYNLWFFDSGSYIDSGGYDCVRTEQINWFKKTDADLRKANGGKKLPSLAFQHIVPREIYDNGYLKEIPAGKDGAAPVTDKPYLTWALNDRKNGQDVRNKDGSLAVTYHYYSPDVPKGSTGWLRESAGSSRTNFGQWKALTEAGVTALFFGHDHINNYVMKRSGYPDLVNTPTAGFGPYGDIDMRGCRVITLNTKNLNTYSEKTVTYQEFYSYRADSAVRSLRAVMYQNLRTFAVILDYPIFKPVLWVYSLFMK